MGMTFEAAIVYGVELWNRDRPTAMEKKFLELFKSEDNPDPQELEDIEYELGQLGLVIHSSGYEWNTVSLVVADFKVKTWLTPKPVPNLSVNSLNAKSIQNLKDIVTKLNMSVDNIGFMLTNAFSP